jgi:hypothetical protein
MADLAKGRLRKKLAELATSLDGRVEEHHRFLLTMQLDRMEEVESTIKKLDLRIDEKQVPYQEHYKRLT